MKSINKIWLTLIIIIPFFACEDVIDVDLEEGNPQLVVDAWINNKLETQTILLQKTQAFFDASPAPTVTGATVTVTDNEGNTFAFEDKDNNGSYTWEPENGVPFGKIGNTYTLSVQIDSEEYSATSKMSRVPPIDSITYEEREADLINPEGIYTEFFARDPIGRGDTYWIKTFKNGSFLNKPQEINIAYDAAFSAGAEVDGLIFIPPIREFTNRVPDDGEGAVDNSDVSPWAFGDSILVELHSITPEAFFFLETSRDQMSLGDAGIFAEPLGNIPTNIVTEQSNDGEKAIGFFTVSAVSSLGRRIEE